MLRPCQLDEGREVPQRVEVRVLMQPEPAVLPLTECFSQQGDRPFPVSKEGRDAGSPVRVTSEEIRCVDVSQCFGDLQRPR